MKKFLTQTKYNREDRPKQRYRNEEERKFSKHDSSGHREDYYADEDDLSMGHKKHSYQIERQSRHTSQVFEKSFKNQDISNYDYKKTRFSTNSTDEYPCLNETIKDKDYSHSGTSENYRNFNNANPLYSKGNAYPYSKNPPSIDKFSKTTDLRIKSKYEISSVNDDEDECFDTQRNNVRINVNAEKRSINHALKNMHLKDECSLSLPHKYDTSLYESKLSLQGYNNQNVDQPNAYSCDLSKNNVYTQEEREYSQSYNKFSPNSYQNLALQNETSFECMGFNMLKLKDLLYYNVNFMQDEQLFEYASAVKCKILENFDKFQQPEKEELEVLCEITDGDQSEKNQQLITTRTCHIIRNIMEKFPLLLNAQETPHSSYQNMCGITNSNYRSPVCKTAQNSGALFTSSKDYNLMSEYNLAQDHKCVVSKEISNSFDIEDFDSYEENCEVQNSSINTAKSNSPIHSSLIITEENKDVIFSEYSCSSVENSGECTPINKFTFDEENSTFIVFGLDNLLKYDVSAMHGDMVFDYAFSMKQRILENIHLFMEPFKEKLELVCELTDGTQREQNQKLINEQMCYLITTAYEENCMRRHNHEQSRNSHQKGSHHPDSRR